MTPKTSNVLAPGAILLAAFLPGCAATAIHPTAAAQSTSAAAPPPKPADTPEAKAVADNKVDIGFPAGGATLTAKANQQLDLAARLYRDAHPIVMYTSGHTDNKGDEFRNVVLSARRAEAVKRGLVARGIPADLLVIQALGESDPANTANPEAAENRRVTITWKLAAS